MVLGRKYVHIIMGTKILTVLSNVIWNLIVNQFNAFKEDISKKNEEQKKQLTVEVKKYAEKYAENRIQDLLNEKFTPEKVDELKGVHKSEDQEFSFMVSESWPKQKDKAVFIASNQLMSTKFEYLPRQYVAGASMVDYHLVNGSPSKTTPKDGDIVIFDMLDKTKGVVTIKLLDSYSLEVEKTKIAQWGTIIKDIEPLMFALMKRAQEKTKNA